MVATLPYSNVYFAKAYPFERLESLLDGIQTAFAYLGGVTDRVPCRVHTAHPLPNQSGNPHQEEIRDQAIEQDPRRAEQPPHEAPGDRHGGG